MSTVPTNGDPKPAREPEFFEREPWQHGFWTGYRLGFTRGRIVAAMAYLKRLAARK